VKALLVGQKNYLSGRKPMLEFRFKSVLHSQIIFIETCVYSQENPFVVCVWYTLVFEINKISNSNITKPKLVLLKWYLKAISSHPPNK